MPDFSKTMRVKGESILEPIFTDRGNGFDMEATRLDLIRRHKHRRSQENSLNPRLADDITEPCLEE